MEHNRNNDARDRPGLIMPDGLSETECLNVPARKATRKLDQLSRIPGRFTSDSFLRPSIIPMRPHLETNIQATPSTLGRSEYMIECSKKGGKTNVFTGTSRITIIIIRSAGSQEGTLYCQEISQHHRYPKRRLFQLASTSALRSRIRQLESFQGLGLVIKPSTSVCASWNSLPEAVLRQGAKYD